MKKIAYALVAAVAMAAASSVGAQTAPEQALSLAEWKPVAEGTTLTFINADGKDELRKFSRVNGFGLTYESVDGKMREDFALQVTLAEERNETIDDSYQKKAGDLWPLTVGKTGSFYHRGITNGNFWQVSDSTKVAGIEDVTVPAGTFRTFIIHNTMDNTPWFEGKRTCWYAPEVGYCVKDHFRSVSRNGTIRESKIELKSVAKPQ